MLAAVDKSRYQGTLIARGLTKTYSTRRVVNGVSLVVRRGEAVGLLGPNGAGKTTCFYMITGLVPVDEGTIEIDGNDVTSMPMYRRSRLGVGYLPQEASIFRGLTVEENIRAVLEVHVKDKAEREKKLDELLDEFHIRKLRKSAAVSLVGRRTSPPGNRPRAGHRSDLHAARRAVRRRRSDLRFRHPEPRAPSDGARHRCSHHRPQCPRDARLIDRAYIIHAGEVLTHGRANDIVNNPEVRRLYLGDNFSL
jgi:lipopolysaccharide export system ATP-binding protein